MSEVEELRKVVEGGYGISVIRGGENFRGWNGIRYRAGMSAKNVGSKKLSMAASATTTRSKRPSPVASMLAGSKS